jgi:ribosomal protein S18 acetylase RimI-like enzyme
VEPSARPLTLLPLTDAEYADFAQRQVAESARQRVTAGEWAPAEALGRAREAHADLLADRLRDRGHRFWKGLDAAGAPVGWLWVSPAPGFLERYGVRDPARARWLSQITVAEGRRRRGYGRALLAALHARLVAEGVEALYLRVYDWNAAARRLYARCGYEVVRQFATDAHLRKWLPAPAPGGGGPAAPLS